jgi:hypothetical protein
LRARSRIDFASPTDGDGERRAGKIVVGQSVNGVLRVFVTTA